MANFNMENDMEVLKSMSEDEKIVYLKALVRLARADGVFDNNEKEFIKEMAVVMGISGDRRDEVLKVSSDEELLKEVAIIKDRRKALELVKEMCMLANSDTDLSEEETMLIGKVGLAMGVDLDKIQQISQWVIDRIIWLEQGKIIFEKY